MATKGMSVFTHQGEDYTINDPNNADEFSTNNNYKNGDYVYYKGDLYVFTTDHSAGAWSGSHAAKVLLGRQMSNVYNSVKYGLKNIEVLFSGAGVSGDVLFTADDLGAYDPNTSVVKYRFRVPASTPVGALRLMRTDGTLIKYLGTVAEGNTERIYEGETNLISTIFGYCEVVTTSRSTPLYVEYLSFHMVGDQMRDLNNQFEYKAKRYDIIQLPETYTRMKYLESKGNGQYYGINPSVFLGPTLRTEIDMQFTRTSGDNMNNATGREGVAGWSLRNAIGCRDADSSGFYFGIGNENIEFGTKDTKRHIFVIDVPNLIYGYDDKFSSKSSFAYDSHYASNDIPLFNQQTNRDTYMRIFEVRFFNNGILYADLIPAKRNSDDKLGFYDIVRNSFYTNPSYNNWGTEYFDHDGETEETSSVAIKKTEATDRYSSHFNGVVDYSAFEYFTDPHIYNKNVGDETIVKFVKKLVEGYQSTPTEFIVCGGDWLQGGNDDVIPGGPSVDQACGQLGYVDGFMRKIFNNYHPVFGNHDNNYKGTELSVQTMKNLMFSKEDDTYYSFENRNVRYFVINTGSDYGVEELTDSHKAQLEWLANSLLIEDKPHIVFAPHIYYSSNSTFENRFLSAVGDELAKLASAYNQRSNYSFDWSADSYDFTSKTGKVEYIIAGHLHHDLIEQNYGIPVIMVKNALPDFGTATYDFVFEDYDNGVLYFDRVGLGELSNRIVHTNIVTISTTYSLSTVLSGNAIEWDSLNDSVATVSDGTVTRISAGYTTIIAKNENNETEAWVIEAQ